MTLIIYYLLIGVGFWMGLSVARLKTFKNASFFSVLKGLLFGILAWPFALIFVYKTYDEAGD